MTMPTRTTIESQRLIRFLLASIGLHAAIALPWVPALEFAGSRETVLTVSLDTSLSADRPRQTPGSAAASERQKVVAAPVASKGIPAAIPDSTKSETAAENTPARDAQTTASPSRSVQAQIEAQLLTDLQRYFEYPLLARRRGWQGTVWLGFTLESDGALERIHVARSSGYDVLDDSAIAALKRVGRLSQAAHRLNGLAFEMSIPVVYRLKDN